MRGERGRHITVALVFTASATVTFCWCGAMSAMPGMEMPGGWTMSMAWMRMPGQGWFGAAASFIGMWTVMMVAMMLPAIAPQLKQRALPVAAGYFGIWILSGALIFPLGAALAALEMQSEVAARLVPAVAGAVVLLAGALQLSRWKTRQLACCRQESAQCGKISGWPHAWREGIRLGLRCVSCCAPLTALLLVLGVMDLAAMVVVTVTITLERLAPAGARIARSTGMLAALAGGCMLAHAALK